MRTLPLLLGLSLLLGGIAHAQQRIVFIDLEKAYDAYDKRKAADQNMKAKIQEFEKEKEGIRVKYTELDEQYKRLREDARNPIFSREKQDAAATEGERVLLQRRELESTIRQLEQDRKRQFEETMRRTQKRLVEDIQTAVREYAQSKGISAVIDKGSRGLSGVPSVLYADPTGDITADIVHIINSGR